jgi:hypothetical protein
MEKRYARVEFYMSHDERDALCAAAAADGRKVSPYVHRVVLAHLQMVAQQGGSEQHNSQPLCAPQKLPMHRDH